MPLTLDRPAQMGLERMQIDPAGFMREWLGADLWPKQVEILEALRDHRRVAVKSCHASGKSFVSARAVLWFLHAFQPSVVITTAPTANQVINVIWRELRTAAGRAGSPLLGRCLTDRYEIAPDWYALGFKADDSAPDRFQGFHSQHALVIIDEAAGVVDSVFDALDAVLTSEAARLLLIGNPTNAGGRFHAAFHESRELYHTITIAAEDTPNMQTGAPTRPYLITQQWIDDAIAEHGEESAYVQSRVRANFPSIEDQALIQLAFVEAAEHRRFETPDDAQLEAGLDVARFGGDENALCLRRGRQVILERSWSGLDTMETVGKVRELLPDPSALGAIKVDVIGLGAGVADRLRELGYPVVDVNVSAASSDPEKYQNLRCELWWDLRDRFKAGDIGGPLNAVTMGQLSAVKYKYDSRHTRPIIESKDELRKRRERASGGWKSPDRAEGLLLAFAQLPIDTSGVLLQGSARGWSPT